MKNILGLDLGTNSIGWALVQSDEKSNTGKIIAANSRIIPMDQGIIGDFDRGNSISQTADRTQYRGTRRIRERSLLRRERLHRVLHVLYFLPIHYANEIDFEKKLGQFKNYAEPKINYIQEQGKNIFLFRSSFEEMLNDFAKNNSLLIADNKKIPYDWTIYYLRNKALTHKIEKEELAWIILNFNQKRGYYQLRGEDDENEKEGQTEEFFSLKVVDVIDSGDRNKDNIWYDVILENDWVYRRQSKVFLDWKGKTKDFIVTTHYDKEGNIKKRSFRAPSENDWTLLKKKTEKDIENSQQTVGTYIYHSLLNNPEVKIKGNLVRTIERKFYREELKQILDKQKEFHEELKNRSLYSACIEELYPRNENHKESIKEKDFTYLFVDDILFYQRPLKSKKSSIATCALEYRIYKDKEGKYQKVPIKCIPKSHPLFQEFRLWQFIQYLKIYQREGEIDGKLTTDIDVTSQLLPTEKDWQDLYDWLCEKAEIKQDILLKYPKFGLKNKVNQYRWNYVEEKIYPCNEFHSTVHSRLQKAGIPNFNKEDELALWHILYSIDDRIDLTKALISFAKKKHLPDTFVEIFKKFPPLKKEYGAYSEHAIKKLLSLMRLGEYWSANNIDKKTMLRINKIIDGEYDENIRNRVREKAINLNTVEDFKGLPLWLASYIIYDRHSEAGEILKWNTPDDIESYLQHYKQHSLRNPIVEQVITETLRVVKDIWTYYGKGQENFFHEIHIELGREMKNTAEKRKKIADRNATNENTNLRIKTLLAEFKESGDIENVRPYSPNQLEIFKIFEEDILNSGIEIPDDIQKIARSAQPSKSEIIKYKLWLEQKYCSPYTGIVIPLSRLFTSDYEIEHVIPQSRYFDDSLSNKVICEAAVNKDKANKLGYEYIKENKGRIIDIGFGRTAKIFSPTEYEEFIKNRFSHNKAKMKKMLLEDIPESFIARQLNDSRYISKAVQGLLSAIVREKEEQELISKNIVSCNGSITSRLKQDWGINDVWNSIITLRFERLNQLTNSNQYGEWKNKDGKRVFQIQVPLLQQKGFNKKRIDHRHHIADSIIIACATRNHVNFLNNQYAKSDKKRYDLKNSLCEKGKFKKPWLSFTQETKETILSSIVSFKQNLRIINKTVNHYYKWEKDENGVYKKTLQRQIKGDSWAIRKPMHKETLYGRITLRNKKEVNLSVALDDWKSLVDKILKTEIKRLIAAYGKFDKKTILKYFKDRENKLNGKDISKVKIYIFNSENAVSRTSLNTDFNSKKIESVVNEGIQKILSKHLSTYNEIKNGKTIEHPELAFSPDGIDELNRNILELNNGKHHKPIHKVRTYEPIGNKFRVGYNGNKKNNYVEAAKGTNLFFAIYQNENGKRSYETIPLNLVIERQKQGLTSVPERNEKGATLLFSLSPNDLVYVPTVEEVEVGQIDWADKKKVAERVYKMVSCTQGEFHCIPYHIATPIIKNIELGSNNKSERAWSGEMIKQNCIPILIDRLGNIKQKL
ncbi:type II CRISPR RNA-guided endonuclease Cas9 [Bacteroides sp. 224]|uniref:type II CRISPR RNA-guided endonuclease Cas9 n=1 Tax=Bacteroides sp. 224 TaxID=2302936 RepID=UPI0013D87FC1|nr:type II CRISPR RNA-guided endonuclease Cas9 [Bacteroides sp. 224]NDV64837.1 type II CRISPR RNA-guided endonuclease Cas9 [Bacteroides sp. 224]